MKWHRPLYDACVRVLLSILRDGYLADRSLEYEFKNHRQWGARDRKFIAETVYEIIRWKRKIIWAIAADESDIHDENSVGMLILGYLFITGKTQEVPDWLSRWKLETLTSWKSRWESQPPSKAISHSLPDWLEMRCQKELGDDWEAIADSLNRPAPVFLRANRLKCNQKHLRERLLKEGIETEVFEDLEDGLKLTERKNVFTTSAFRDGWFEVQDGGSQKIAPFLEVSPGQRVIDACAGAGGKTLHLAALMKNKGKIIALDIHDKKLAELRTRAARAGADIIEAKQIEGTKTIKRLKDSADRLLLDVPCSGSGVWRRNSDSRWRISESEVEQIRQTQIQILTTYTQMVKRGGIFVYATCSLWPSENELQIQNFLEAYPGEFELLSTLKISPSDGRYDGFYGAKIRRLSK